MKNLGNNNLVRPVLFLLGVGIIFFGVLSIVTMNHEMAMVSTGPNASQGSNCADPHDTQSCLDYHLGVMHDLSTATFSNLDAQLIIFFLFSFVGLLAMALLRLLEYGHVRQKIRLRQLYEKTITAFALQLGYWLSLFEKRDPSRAFVMA